MDLPKQVQDRLMQFQNIQNQLQMIVYQKQQLIMQNNELENAASELEKPGVGKVYKASGPLFIEINKDESQKDVKEARETNDARIKLLEKQEVKLTEKSKEMREELEGALKGYSKPKDAG